MRDLNLNDGGVSMEVRQRPDRGVQVEVIRTIIITMTFIISPGDALVGYTLKSILWKNQNLKTVGHSF